MIYFIRSGEFVKIGVADNPWNRLYDLQIGSPNPLELLAVAPGEYETEREYHRMFAYCRHKGEWYVYDQLIDSAIEGIKRNHPRLQDRDEVRRIQKANANKPKNRRPVSTSPVEAVRLVVNTAVLMMENEPGIDVRSVTESKRGPGILIWIPGYVDNAGTIIVAEPQPAPTEATP